MARHWNPIMMNAVLFGRIALLHENRANLKLTGEEMRLLERTYTRFHRAGAGLSDEAKKRMAEINERLAHLGTSFSHHLLGDEQDWVLELWRGRLRRAVRQLRGGRQGRGRRARHGRQGDRDAVALLRGAVPEELRPARPAREGLQGLHRPRRQRQCQRQQGDHWRDPGAARGEREAAGLSDLRRLPARGLHGQDAGGRARPAGAGLEAGAGRARSPIATSCRR